MLTRLVYIGMFFAAVFWSSPFDRLSEQEPEPAFGTFARTDALFSCGKWKVDMEAYVNAADQPSENVKAYFDYLISLYSDTEPLRSKRVETAEGRNPYLSLDKLSEKFVPVVVLPNPRFLRNAGRRYSEIHRGATVFFEPGKDSKWPTRLASTPIGDGNTILHLSEEDDSVIQMTLRRKKLVTTRGTYEPCEWPLSSLKIGAPEGAKWTGLLSTELWADDNCRVFTCSYCDNEFNQHLQIVYALVDANGRSFRENGGLYRHREFLANPHNPMHDELNSLLCLPIPNGTFDNVSTRAHEAWGINEWYAQHAKPIWGLYIKKDSEVGRETFYVEAIDEKNKEGKELIQIIVFDHAQPTDILETLDLLTSSKTILEAEQLAEARRLQRKLIGFPKKYWDGDENASDSKLK